MASALALLLRSVINPHLQYRFAVPKKIEKVAWKLYRKIQANPDYIGDDSEDDEEESDINEADSDDEDDYPQDLALPLVSPDLAVEDDDICPPENEVCADPATEAVEDDVYPYGLLEKREVPTFNDEIQGIILELLQLLYTQNLSDGPNSSFNSVFIRYIMLPLSTAYV